MKWEFSTSGWPWSGSGHDVTKHDLDLAVKRIIARLDELEKYMAKLSELRNLLAPLPADLDTIKSGIAALQASGGTDPELTPELQDLVDRTITGVAAAKQQLNPPTPQP